MSAEGFNLRAAVAHVLDTTDLAEPRDIAAKVAESVPAKHRLEALTIALDPYVREAIQHRRHVNPIIGAKPSRSAKVTAIRAAWARALRDRIHVGPGSEAWKPLGDCTYEDLLFAAEERREHARQNAAAAERYAALAELLRANDVECVSDLPDDVLRDLIGGAA